MYSVGGRSYFCSLATPAQTYPPPLLEEHGWHRVPLNVGLSLMSHGIEAQSEQARTPAGLPALSSSLSSPSL